LRIGRPQLGIRDVRAREPVIVPAVRDHDDVGAERRDLVRELAEALDDRVPGNSEVEDLDLPPPARGECLLEDLRPARSRPERDRVSRHGHAKEAGGAWIHRQRPAISPRVDGDRRFRVEDAFRPETPEQARVGTEEIGDLARVGISESERDGRSLPREPHDPQQPFDAGEDRDRDGDTEERRAISAANFQFFVSFDLE
jgi:hypothetical protein